MMWRAATILAVMGCIHCGGSGGASQANGGPANGPIGSSRVPALRLGHYSSGDGLVGFVLDRTGSVPKLHIDGTREILNLEIVRRSRTSFDLVNHERHIGIGVDDDGEVIFSQRGAGPNRRMVRDADASPL